MAQETHLDIESLRKDLAKFSEQMSVLADSVRNWTSEAGADSYARARRAGQAVEKQIERHPLTSVVTTFAAGVAVGLLLPRGDRH